MSQPQGLRWEHLPRRGLDGEQPPGHEHRCGAWALPTSYLPAEPRRHGHSPSHSLRHSLTITVSHSLRHSHSLRQPITALVSLSLGVTVIARQSQPDSRNHSPESPSLTGSGLWTLPLTTGDASGSLLPPVRTTEPEGLAQQLQGHTADLGDGQGLPAAPTTCPSATKLQKGSSEWPLGRQQLPPGGFPAPGAGSRLPKPGSPGTSLFMRAEGFGKPQSRATPRSGQSSLAHLSYGQSVQHTTAGFWVHLATENHKCMESPWFEKGHQRDWGCLTGGAGDTRGELRGHVSLRSLQGSQKQAGGSPGPRRWPSHPVLLGHSQATRCYMLVPSHPASGRSP